MDLMAIRRGLIAQGQNGLPSAYQQIEWLESSGTQYIATNYVPTAGYSVEIKYLFSSNFTGDKMIYGAYSDANNQNSVEPYAQSRWYTTNGLAKYSNVLTHYGCSSNTIYTFTMDSDSASVDGHTTVPTGTVTSASSYPIYIFAWNSNGIVQYIHNSLRIYKLTFKNNGALSADFIPCIRKSDNEPGMYDTVSKTFYTNAGTGTFLIPT